jgi:hypothetical protein
VIGGYSLGQGFFSRFADLYGVNQIKPCLIPFSCKGGLQ